MKKLICLFISAVLICSSAIPFFATATQAEDSPNFVAMTKEQYDELIDLLKYGTAEEKQFAVDYIYNFGNSDSTSYSWTQNYAVTLPDGTSELHGFVKFDSYFGLMSIRTVVPAVMRGESHYGYTWYSVDSDAATSLPRSGNYEYEGRVTTNIVSARELYIAVFGNYTVSEENALSMGFSLEVFESSYTVGTTVYYRYYDEDTHIEYSPVRVN